MIEPLAVTPTDNVDLQSMTKGQLLDYAKASGIDGVSGSMKKAEIISAISDKN